MHMKTSCAVAGTSSALSEYQLVFPQVGLTQFSFPVPHLWAFPFLLWSPYLPHPAHPPQAFVLTVCCPLGSLLGWCPFQESCSNTKAKTFADGRNRRNHAQPSLFRDLENESYPREGTWPSLHNQIVAEPAEHLCLCVAPIPCVTVPSISLVIWLLLWWV